MLISFLFALIFDYLYAIEFKFLIFITLIFFFLNNFIYFPLIFFSLIILLLLILKPKYGLFSIVQFFITLVDYLFFTPLIFWFNNNIYYFQHIQNNKLYGFLVLLLFVFYFLILQIKNRQQLKIIKTIFIVFSLVFLVYFNYLVLFKDKENKLSEEISKKHYFFVKGNYLKKECVQWAYYIKPNKNLEQYQNLLKNKSLVCKSFKNLTKKNYFLIVLNKKDCFIIK